MQEPSRLPAVFIGHGSPMNALDDNDFTRAWAAVARRFPTPRAILCVSAHWETKGTLVTAAAAPRTIHDFYNFPQALYDIAYPAPGDPALAKDVATLLAPGARADLDGWGLDHGAWSILRHMYPEARVPVLQLSLDVRCTPAQHYGIGRKLAGLRDDGVLLLGSGNIVHNLRQFRRDGAPPVDWALRFNDWAKDRIAARDHAALAAYESLGADARLAVPESEHFLPLLYVLATQTDAEGTEVFADAVTSSISMTSVGVGLPH